MDMYPHELNNLTIQKLESLNPRIHFVLDIRRHQCIHCLFIVNLIHLLKLKSRYYVTLRATMQGYMYDNCPGRESQNRKSM